MSAFVPDVPHAPVDAVLTLTGERTIPGLDVENYWFRRHEVVYQQLAPRCAGREVLEAGCGEGYGADLIAGVARRVIALDYDEATVAHVRAHYPRVEVVHGNLAELPLADASVDVVVNFQVIEHLWNQAQFVGERPKMFLDQGSVEAVMPRRHRSMRRKHNFPAHARSSNRKRHALFKHARAYRFQNRKAAVPFI